MENRHVGDSCRLSGDIWFDDTIWTSLRNDSIVEQYICLLKKLYADQHASILTNAESKELEITHDTKQDDPLSRQPSVQFSLPISNGERHWYVEREGLWHHIRRRKRDYISILTLTDDVLLMTNSLSQLKKIMTDFLKEAQKRKDLNVPRQNENSYQLQKHRQKEIEIDEMHVGIRRRSQIPRTDDIIHGSRNHRNTAQNPLYLVRVDQAPTGIAIQVLPAPTQVTSFWFCCHIDNSVYGLQQKNTNNWSVLHSAKCFVSSLGQREDTEQKKEKTWEKEIFKMMRGASLPVNRTKKTAHKMDVTETAFHSRTIHKAPQVKKRREKIGLSTLKEAQKKQMKKCRHTTSQIGSRHKGNWNDFKPCELPRKVKKDGPEEQPSGTRDLSFEQEPTRKLEDRPRDGRPERVCERRWIRNHSRQQSEINNTWLAAASNVNE